MSSMFKKKGGLAFKPKIPSSRPRPTAASSKPNHTEAPTSDTVAEENVQSHSQGADTTGEVGNQRASAAPSQPLPPATGDGQAATQRKSRRETSRGPAEVPRENSHIETPGFDKSDTSHQTAGGKSNAQPEPSSEPADPAAGYNIPVPPPENTSSEPAPLTAEEQAAAVLLATAAAKSRAASTVDDIEPATVAARAPPSSVEPPKRRTPRRKASEATAEPRESRPQRKGKASLENAGEPRAPRKRKARSATPEDAETQLVDLQALKMSDLTKDLHIGKKFSRHDELRERERQKRLKTKLAKGGEGGEEGPEARPEPSQDRSSAPSVTAPQTAAGEPTQSGPQFRIVDGQIVVDQTSLVMDRHARAAAAQAGEDMETIEENDFTRLITSNSFMNTSKLRGPNNWSDMETELFYRGLRMFGTDFEMISKMFPGKQRRHVKLKFNREERHNCKRIDAVLIGEKTTKMDIDEYKSITGTQFESVEKIEAEQKKIEEDYEAERKRIADEQAEIMRKKKEQLFADDEANDDKGKKKKTKGRKKKGAVEYGLNGEPVNTEN